MSALTDIADHARQIAQEAIRAAQEAARAVAAAAKAAQAAQTASAQLTPVKAQVAADQSPDMARLALNAAKPVLQETARTVGAGVEAVQVGPAVDKLNSDGDAVYMRTTLEAKAALQIGVKGQFGGDLEIRQVGDGDEAKFRVALDKEALAAVTGQLSIPQLPVKAELGIQTFDRVEMTFATKEEATRAAQIVQRMAAADVATDANPLGSLSGAGPNPLANPLNESGAPGDLATRVAGVSAADKAFLQDNVTAYETTVGSRGRLALEAKVPQLFAPFQPEIAGELRLDGRQQLTRRVELPTDTEEGKLIYTMGQDVRLSAKEKVTFDPLPTSQLVAGFQVQNRNELGRGRMEVSAEFDLPAGDVTRSPLGGRAVPEVDLLARGELGVPDRIVHSVSAEWRDQSLLDKSRNDTNEGTIKTTIENPENAMGALRELARGNPGGVTSQLGTTVEAEVKSIVRSGFDVQLGPKLEIGEGNKAEVTAILAAGMDDVVGTRKLTIGQTEPVAAPATPTGDDGKTLMVTPRDGLTLRDAPEGERTGVFQNGTFLRRNGEDTVTPTGERWVPVTGTDLNDKPVQGYVNADYVQPHPSTTGAMDATGRINPALAEQRYQTITAAKGDNLWDLANRSGTKFEDIVALNANHLARPALIFEGDTIYVPGTAKGPAAPVAAPAAPPVVTSEKTGETRVDGTGSVPVAASMGDLEKVGRSASNGTPANPAAPDQSLSGTPAAPAQPEPVANAPVGPAAPVAPPAKPTVTDPARPDLATLLRTHQVAEDARTQWTPKVFGVEVPEWASRLAGQDRGSVELGTTEAGLLDELNPLALKDWGDISNGTGKISLQAYPQPAGDGRSFMDWNNDGHTDAHRHALWNARMTQKFGEDWTAAYATAHEKAPANPGAREAMDLYNNEVGRRIGRDNPNASVEDLSRLVQTAVTNGELLVVDKNGALAWSDQVAVGNHGKAANTSLPADPDYGQNQLRRGN